MRGYSFLPFISTRVEWHRQVRPSQIEGQTGSEIIEHLVKHVQRPTVCVPKHLDRLRSWKDLVYLLRLQLPRRLLFYRFEDRGKIGTLWTNFCFPRSKLQQHIGTLKLLSLDPAEKSGWISNFWLKEKSRKTNLSQWTSAKAASHYCWALVYL